MLAEVTRVNEMRLCYNMIMNRKVGSGGFTLIELSLAMTFIGILSVIVVVLIQNVSASYRRGITLNQINTVGMDIIDDFRSSVQNASSNAIERLCEIEYGYKTNTNWEECTKDNAMSFIYLKKTASVTIDSGLPTANTISKMPIYGVVCTGTYTYIWNSGYLFTDGDNVRVSVNGKTSLADKQTLAAKLNGKIYRLAKIYDNERKICIDAAKEYNKNNNGDKYTAASTINNENKLKQSFSLDSDDPNNDKMVDVLGQKNDLVLYDFYLATPAMSEARGNLFYSGSMILGTMNGGINIKVAGNSCKPPNDTSGYESLQYCAINKFNFAMMAGG